MSKSFNWILLPVLVAFTGMAAAMGQMEPDTGMTTDLASACPAEYQRFAASAVDGVRVQEYYRRQGDQLQWQDVARRNLLRSLLEDLQYDGLEPQEYLHGLQQAGTAPVVPYCTDAGISHDYLLALHHLQHGRLVQAGVEPYWVEAAAALRQPLPVVDLALQTAGDLARSFAQARPAQLLYAQLREQLRDGAWLQQDDWIVVAAGKSLKPGIRDARVVDLRLRLQQGGVLPVDQPDADSADPYLYDERLETAVKAFQADHYLEDDGIVGPATLTELNVSPRQRLMQVRVNLERLRWLEKYLEPNLLIVDIAGARLLYVENGQVAWRTRTQVGTVGRQTPLLKSRITHLTMNPTWTVPPTIFRKDKLPAIRKDIGYLERSRMQVLNGQGQVLDPYSVDWSAPGNIMLRQAAGPGNALGRVAIRFANPFSVYLHDTPSQHLFGRATRTVSSGCVRVEGVFSLLDLLAADDSTRQRIKQLLDSGETRQVNLARLTPVLLAYWTVEVDVDGRLRFRADSYGLDQRVAEALERGG